MIDFKDMLSWQRIRGMAREDKDLLSTDDLADILSWLTAQTQEIRALKRIFEHRLSLTTARELGKAMRAAKLQSKEETLWHFTNGSRTS